MPHPPYSSFSIEWICAPLCQQVRYCTLSILDSTLSKARTTCQFRTDSEHHLIFSSRTKQKILKPLRFQDFSWSEWRDLNSRPLDPQSFIFSNNSKTKRKTVKLGTIGAFEIPTFISVSNILILFRTDSERRLRSNRCAVMLLRASTLNNQADFR